MTADFKINPFSYSSPKKCDFRSFSEIGYERKHFGDQPVIRTTNVESSIVPRTSEKKVVFMISQE